jgi:uncharacterized protein YoxC
MAMPFSPYVDPDVLALTRQAQGLIEQTKTLVSDIDHTVVELNEFKMSKQKRMEAARAKWQEREDDDAEH